MDESVRQFLLQQKPTCGCRAWEPCEKHAKEHDEWVDSLHTDAKEAELMNNPNMKEINPRVILNELGMLDKKEEFVRELLELERRYEVVLCCASRGCGKTLILEEVRKQLLQENKELRIVDGNNFYKVYHER